MKELLYQLRWALPVWFVGLATNWLPENRVTVRLRGRLLAPFIRSCGRNFQVGAHVVLRETDRLTVGNDVYIARGSWIDCTGGVTLEDEVMFGPFVVLSTALHVFRNGSARFAGSVARPVSVGRGSWIAAHAGIRAGVTIGRGVLVAANSFVSDDVPDGMMAGGVPAKVIKPVQEIPAEFHSRQEFLQDGRGAP